MSERAVGEIAGPSEAVFALLVDPAEPAPGRRDE
jgi:hypothetical protein